MVDLHDRWVSSCLTKNEEELARTGNCSVAPIQREFQCSVKQKEKNNNTHTHLVLKHVRENLRSIEVCRSVVILSQSQRPPTDLTMTLQAFVVSERETTMTLKVAGMSVTRHMLFYRMGEVIKKGDE